MKLEQAINEQYGDNHRVALRVLKKYLRRCIKEKIYNLNNLVKIAQEAFKEWGPDRGFGGGNFKIEGLTVSYYDDMFEFADVMSLAKWIFKNLNSRFSQHCEPENVRYHTRRVELPGKSKPKAGKILSSHYFPPLTAAQRFECIDDGITPRGDYTRYVLALTDRGERA